MGMWIWRMGIRIFMICRMGMCFSRIGIEIYTLGMWIFERWFSSSRAKKICPSCLGTEPKGGRKGGHENHSVLESGMYTVDSCHVRMPWVSLGCAHLTKSTIHFVVALM